MRTKKIFYLDTTQNTYMRRHDLYNAGARWDAKAKRWWAESKVVLNKAAQMVGGDAQVVTAHVQGLPKQGKTFRGGRPRKPRNGFQPESTVTLQPTTGEAPVQPVPIGVPMGNEPAQPMVVSGQPFVRGARGEDRRKSHDRRNEGSRPDAVLVVPMAAEAVPTLP